MASMRSTLTISISTPASSNFLRKVLNWATVRDRRHFSNSSAAAPCAACCSGVNAPPRPPAAPRPAAGDAAAGDPRKEGFDGLRPQLHGAESELHRIIERFVRAHIIVAVAVRHVDADLYSAELGIRLCQEACGGESHQRHPAYVPSRTDHFASFRFRTKQN